MGTSAHGPIHAAPPLGQCLQGIDQSTHLFSEEDGHYDRRDLSGHRRDHGQASEHPRPTPLLSSLHGQRSEHGGHHALRHLQQTHERDDGSDNGRDAEAIPASGEVEVVRLQN